MKKSIALRMLGGLAAVVVGVTAVVGQPAAKADACTPPLCPAPPIIPVPLPTIGPIATLPPLFPTLRPDLTMNIVSVNREGSGVRVKYWLHNSGPVGTGAFQTKMTFDNASIVPLSHTINEAALGAGAWKFRSVFILQFLPPGTYTVAGLVDSAYQVNESNGWNNSDLFTFVLY